MAMTMNITDFRRVAPYCLMFQSNLLRSSSELKMDAESSSETSVRVYHNVRYHVPEEYYGV